MGQKICILVLLTALSAPQVGTAQLANPPKPGSCPAALKPLPRSVSQAADRIVRNIHPEWRKTLLKTKREDLDQFQYVWGTGIRDSLCLQAGNNDQLLRSACGGKLCHPEDASMIIMETVWDRLQVVKKVMPPVQAASNSEQRRPGSPQPLGRS